MESAVKFWQLVTEATSAFYKSPDLLNILTCCYGLCRH